MRFSRVSRWLVSALLAGSTMFSSGCSLFVNKMQAIKITASEPTAEILVDGAPVGKGTIAIELDRTRSHTVTAKTPYGKVGAAAINKRISGTGILDIVGGIFFLVPFIGVVGPGFWELEPEDVTVLVH